MTLTIELEETTEKRLRARAASLGLPLGEYAGILLNEASALPEPTEHDTVSSRRERRLKMLRKWLKSHSDVPSMTEEAYDRASFYEDRF